MGSWRNVAVEGVLLLSITVLGGLACEVREPLGTNPAAPATTPTAMQAGSTTVSTGAGGSGAGGSGAGGSGATITTNDGPQIEQELMDRWNRVAASVPSNFSFIWPAFDQFPHPTYKGGSAEAYQVFAVVLLNFFRADDNFAFLSANHLFGLRLRYIFASGQSGLDTSFAELAAYFSSPSAFGNIPASTQMDLGVFSDRIKSMM